MSGGFTLFTGAVAERIGFQENRANELLVADGKLTGEVREPILGRAAKLATLIELRKPSTSTTSTRWWPATAPTISA